MEDFRHVVERRIGDPRQSDAEELGGDKDLNLRPAMPLTAFVVFWLYHYEPHFISYKISRAVPTSQGDWMLKVHVIWTSTL